MKALFIYEELHPPYDEGMKKFAHKVHSEISKEMDTCIINDICWLPVRINNLLITPRILFSYILHRPDIVIYVPKQSLTFFSLLKTVIFRVFMHDSLRTIGLQKRNISANKVRLLRKLNFGKVLVLSRSMSRDLEKLGIKADIIYTGVDINRFKPETDSVKATYRKKYNIPQDKIILLHVGHIRSSRNLELLININRKFDNCQVVVVGSTATSRESETYERCLQAEIIIIDQAIDDINEIYASSDIYVFPVKIESGAMETPLSVLEAMSTNLPVLTTRFGQLTELFGESDHFKYVESIDEIDTETIEQMTSSACMNRKQVLNFTWQATAEKIVSA
jgi:glycosyltransferase involved in cell wall biosynthesis